MHVDAIEARAFQRRREFGEQQRVGGQREAIDAGNAREALDYFDEVEPQRRLAAGQPEFSKADADGGARDGLEFRRRQQLVLGQEAQSLERHAIDASQVACVDYREPQVVYFTIEGVAGHKSIVIGAARAKQLSAAQRRSILPICARRLLSLVL